MTPIYIVTPCHDGMYHGNYVAGIEASARSPHYAGSIRSELESDIGRHRSKIASMLVTDSRFANCKHFLWVDADIGWTRQDFDRIATLPDDMHIVGGAYVKKDGKGEVVARGKSVDIDPQTPSRVSCIGLGFTRISMEVMKAVYASRGAKTKHEWRPVMMGGFYDVDGGVGYEGEDYAFCIKAGQLGYSTWLDWSIKVTHRGFKVYEV